MKDRLDVWDISLRCLNKRKSGGSSNSSTQKMFLELTLSENLSLTNVCIVCRNSKRLVHSINE